MAAVPEYKLGYILAYIQGITADEKSDDLYCRKLYEDYLRDPDPNKEEEYTLSDCKKEWGDFYMYSKVSIELHYTSQIKLKFSEIHLILD